MKSTPLFLQLLIILVAASVAPVDAAPQAKSTRPNILFISVDDMSCDSVGAFGCKLSGTTPHIDRLATQGLRFQYAHVQVGNCMPSRNVMFSGRYPHNNRVEGFYPVRDPDYPVLVDLFKQHAYFTAIHGKVGHSTPYHPYAWDLVLGVTPEKAHPKDVQAHYKSTQQGIAAAADAEKPFCLLMNVSDPHKPFYGVTGKGQPFDDPHKTSRIFTAEEVPVPGFLPDHPDVRTELAHYYSSVRRADDCVGVILKALAESGQQQNTVVIFLSDHGMPLPFAKTAVYHHSTHTPWIVRWPGVTQAGAIDTTHMISAVDLLPTLLDVADIKHPQGFDGRSFLPLLQGETQDGRDMIFKDYNENAGGGRHPMRSVQTRTYGYIFNPWTDGERVFKTATTGTATYRTMKQLAETDPLRAARVELFDHRVREEFYDYENDPDALHNLIDDPAHQTEINKLRQALEDWMVRTNDHALDVFRHRDDEKVVAAYMTRIEQESAARRKNRGNGNRRSANRKSARLIKLQAPANVVPGKPSTVRVAHTIPEKLGEQLIHVTIKQGNGKQRINRKVLKVQGTGTLEVTFEVPKSLIADGVQFAAFIGKDYPSSLQHVTSGVVRAAPDE
ncbi:MAG: heparan N-sulfatase [Planctomycetaceae bacterium]|nr:heparan N-sulfatase [Planctomycetaceae bacterium]